MKVFKLSIMFFLLVCFFSGVYAVEYNFVTCGAAKYDGPTQSECNAYYSGENNVNIVNGGMQEWEVPQDGRYRLTVVGAEGGDGSHHGGLGAKVSGVYNLDKGQTLTIVVGHQGWTVNDNNLPVDGAWGGGGGNTGSSCNDGGTGGGASDIRMGGTDLADRILVGAGGGGGSYTSGDAYGGDGGIQQGQDGGIGLDGTDQEATGGTQTSGGQGGRIGEDGSLGQGGAGEGYNCGGGGGGGGYYGGGGSTHNGAGGGSSLTGGENQNNVGGTNSGDGYVNIELLTNPDDPIIQNVNFDTTAGDPATIEGSFDVNIDDDGGNAPNNQLETCTVMAEGTGSGGQVNLGTNINGNTCSFSVDNDDHGNWDPDEELEFSMSVEDSYSGTDSLTRYRQFPVNPPNEPDQPSPGNNVESVDTESSLQVRATHPDGLDMDVRFYLDDETGFSQVGPTRTVSDGSTPSVSPELDPGTEYTWYAEASTQGRTAESARWSFTTNYRPSVESINFEDSSEGHALNFSSEVSDRDGGGQISGGTLTVTDGEGNQETYSINPESTEGNEATFSQVVSYQDNEDWSQVEDLQFDFEVEDSPGLSSSDTGSASLPNHEPVIESIETSEYNDRDAFEASALITSPDSGSGEIRSCSIIIEDSENSYSAGSLEEVNSTHVRCVQENIGPGQFPGLSTSDSLQLTVRTTDIHGATSTQGLAYNAPTGIDYRYTSMIIPAGGVDFLPYQLSNDGSIETEFRVELQDVDASFTSNGQDSRTFELAPGTTESMQIQVSPSSDFSGTEQLRILTENLDSGVNQTQKVDVKVRDASGSTERSVPGVGLIQILVMALFAMFIYGRRNIV